MDVERSFLTSAGYILAAAAYLLFTGLLLAAFRRKLRAPLLAIAAATTVAWGLVHAQVLVPLGRVEAQVYIAEFCFDAAWLLYLSSLLSGVSGSALLVIFRLAGPILAMGCLALGLLWPADLRAGFLSADTGKLLVFGQILTSLVAIVYLEQIYRNARSKQRRELKYLCLAIGSIFVFDLLMYSNAVISGALAERLWSARGYLVTMTLPLTAFAIARSPKWSGGIFVSRQIVFHTTALFGAGVYLVTVGLVGEYVLSIGGDWGSGAQAVFLSGAVLALLVLLLSDTLRARARVFISKHFYRNKYDYRQEWLRLTETLTGSDDPLPARKRAIKALADITGSRAGLLWLRPEDERAFTNVSNWNTGPASKVFDVDDSLPRYLEERAWIVDCVEARGDPARYAPLDVGELDAFGMSDPCLVVPLFNARKLLGFMVLSSPPTRTSLNYEDHDLLKTAGRQIASFLAQDSATETLTQNRQFEAYNKLTAYIMHDLKNVIAQQSLVIANAKKHRSKPEFVDDAMETIRAGVARMRRVIEQLRQGNIVNNVENVELGTLIMTAVSDCADRLPNPKALIGDARYFAKGDRERLHMAVYHAIRNAQDATPPDGSVTVKLARPDNGTFCVIEVADTGTGMDPDFVRDRLFRPFDSTKGTAGMGIGAYQIRETFRQHGGSVVVASLPDHGTTVSMYLPVSAEV